jgi:uncharacterized repeat protein (TIGR01451 family)
MFINASYASSLGFVEQKATKRAGVFQLMSPDGKHLYTLELDNSRGHELNVYTRDPNNGRLEPGQGFKDNANKFSPSGLIISPDNKDVYVTAIYGNNSDGPNRRGLSILHFSRDTQAGQLTYQQRLLIEEPIDFSNPTGQMSFGPNGYYLYAGEIGADASIAVFTRGGDGGLSYVETISKDVNGDALGGHLTVEVANKGKSLYALSSDGLLYVFLRNSTGGKLTPIQTLNEPNSGASAFTTSADGKFLYVASPGGVFVYSINPETGELNFSTKISADTDGDNPQQLRKPNSIILSNDPEQNFAYIDDSVATKINIYRRDKENGSLTWVNEEKDRAGVPLHHLLSLTRSPNGYFLYALNNTPSEFSVFDVRADLDLVKTDSDDPVAPSGKFVYTLTVTNNGPSDALNVIVSDPLPEDVLFNRGSVNASGTSCIEQEGTVTCKLDRITISSKATASIEVTAPDTEGKIASKASVESDQIDTQTNNNTSTEETRIKVGGASGTSVLSESSSSNNNKKGGGNLGIIILAVLGGTYPLRRKYRKGRINSAADIKN